MNACKIRRGSKGWSGVMRTKAALNDVKNQSDCLIVKS